MSRTPSTAFCLASLIGALKTPVSPSTITNFIPSLSRHDTKPFYVLAEIHINQFPGSLILQTYKVKHLREFFKGSHAKPELLRILNWWPTNKFF